MKIGNEVIVEVGKEVWKIELTDLGVHQAFMGYPMGDKYLMIGITSPDMESQISINSLPDNDNDEIKIPIELEKCNTDLKGSIEFVGIEKLLANWELYFFDNRIESKVRIEPKSPVNINIPGRNTRSEKLRMAGFAKTKEGCSSIFELRIKRKAG